MSHKLGCPYDPSMTGGFDPSTDFCTCAEPRKAPAPLPQAPVLTKIQLDKISELTTDGACSPIQAKEALELREWNVELAAEYVNRCGLAAVMSDRSRYPLWHAYLDRRLRKWKEDRKSYDRAESFVILMLLVVVSAAIRTVLEWLWP